MWVNWASRWAVTSHALCCSGAQALESNWHWFESWHYVSVEVTAIKSQWYKNIKISVASHQKGVFLSYVTAYLCIYVFGALYICNGISLVAQMVKSLPAMQEIRFDPWVRKIPWRRKWQPTPVFMPRELHGQRNLVGYSPWDCKELDMVEQLTHFTHICDDLQNWLAARSKRAQLGWYLVLQLANLCMITLRYIHVEIQGPRLLPPSVFSGSSTSATSKETRKEKEHGESGGFKGQGCKCQKLTHSTARTSHMALPRCKGTGNMIQ